MRRGTLNIKYNLPIDIMMILSEIIYVLKKVVCLIIDILKVCYQFQLKINKFIPHKPNTILLNNVVYCRYYQP